MATNGLKHEIEKAVKLAQEIEMIKQKNNMLREACNIRSIRMGPPVFEYGVQQRGVESPVLTNQELYW